MKKKTVGELIYAARKKKGLTVREVQEIAKNEISHTFLNQVENYNHQVSPTKLKVISQALDLDYLKLMRAAGYL